MDLIARSYPSLRRLSIKNIIAMVSSLRLPIRARARELRAQAVEWDFHEALVLDGLFRYVTGVRGV